GMAPRGLKTTYEEAAGTKGAGRLEGEGDGQRDERQPGDHDRAAVAGAPSPDALEAVHGRPVMLAVWYLASARDDLHALVRKLPEQPPGAVRVGRRRDAAGRHHREGGLLRRGPVELDQADHRPERQVALRPAVPRLGRRVRRRAAAGDPRGRELALPRGGADPPVYAPASRCGAS